MKALTALAMLTCLALPAAAQSAAENRSFFLEVHIDQPLHGLRDSAGSGAGVGGNLGYVFNATSHGRVSRTLALKIDSDEFADHATRREAHGLGFGPELTLYFGPDYRGVFLSAEATVYAWSLTNRASGTLQNQTYLRSGGAAALGYRFRNGFSVEALWKSAILDSDLRMDSVGLGFRMAF